ncbi:MAG TPA: response regulator transcription factor [Anaerolineae bacterium]|nr:response regulator transcription factor [Anaerolineae bacterium]
MSEANSISVLIVDDQRLMREGLATLLALAPDLRIAGQAGDGAEAIALALALRPDVVLMDIRMPGTDGVAATRAIRAALPDTQVIILTTFDDDEYVLAGLRAGACGYLLKDMPSEQLADAIRAAARGESPLEPAVARKLVNLVARSSAGGDFAGGDFAGGDSVGGDSVGGDFVGGDSSRRQSASGDASYSPNPLSEREIEVLRLIAQGHSNKEIAEKLVIAEGTAKNHVSNILSKLNARDRAQAVARGQELGLL